MRSERGELLLGIDGGGTKTEFVLFDRRGQAVRRLVLGGSNPNSVGMEQTLRVLTEGIRQMTDASGALAGVHAGVAGCSNPNHQQTIRAAMGERFAQLPFSISSDTMNVFYSAPGVQADIAAICGTGSVVFARTQSGFTRIGGWGYAFDCGGSGYDIGRDAVRAVFAAYDGIGPQTALCALLEEAVGGNLWENVHRLYAAPPEKIAGFAPKVLAAWEAGDEVAREILQRNMERLAFLINSAAQLVPGARNLILSGGLTARVDMLGTFLYPKLLPALQTIIPQTPQIYGACALCARQYGGQEEGFAQEFMRSYRKIREADASC
ncbi:MAG: BadF/BadG/BcrA/BcrD ATPase family protein [Eubacteriales bacterium]|nr:BadF/BadG/BcrA/BcrD ATPase family protein [Eubacteriales bacterium]